MRPKIALFTECHIDHCYSKKNLENITALLSDRYDLYPINVKKDQWTYTGQGKTVEVDKNDFSLNLNGEKVKFDTALNIIDDMTGENANIQG